MLTHAIRDVLNESLSEFELLFFCFRWRGNADESRELDEPQSSPGTVSAPIPFDFRLLGELSIYIFRL